MELRDRLESHPVTNLRKEISKKAKEINLRGYSKMKKAALINFMLDHKDKFNYIQVHTKAKKVKKEKEPEPKKKKIKFKLTGKSGSQVMQEKEEKEKPKKKIIVKRKVKGKKVVGGSVDGKEI
tara:strand:+ start:297 stop:665 length:369 start_codon:yes stop_codon:yes gene_type:complete